MKTEVQKIEAQEALPADPMVSLIERVATDPNADIEKLERMLAMKERMDAKNAEQEFASAFARASVNFPSIPKNGVGHQNKPYALLSDIISHTREPLAENGLALTFDTKVDGEKVLVSAVLMHRSGHSRSTSIELPRDTSGSKNNVQAVGSSQTYGQRYAAQSVLGLSLGDDTEDDARSAGQPAQQPKRSVDPWSATILDELPENATPRDKGKALAEALVRQFQRMKGVRQISNEWDRREHIIAKLEQNDPDLHETVVDAYENRMDELKEAQN